MLSYLPPHSEVRKHQQHELVQKSNKPTSKSYHNPDHNNLLFPKPASCTSSLTLQFNVRQQQLQECQQITGVVSHITCFGSHPRTSSFLAETDVWFASTSGKSSDTSSLFQKQTYFEGREGSASPIAVCRLRGATGEWERRRGGLAPAATTTERARSPERGSAVKVLQQIQNCLRM